MSGIRVIKRACITGVLPTTTNKRPAGLSNCRKFSTCRLVGREPVIAIASNGPSASSVILVEGESTQVSFGNLDKALATVDTQLRLFGKPESFLRRRMGVALACAETLEEARSRAREAAARVRPVA